MKPQARRAAFDRVRREKPGPLADASKRLVEGRVKHGCGPGEANEAWSLTVTIQGQEPTEDLRRVKTSRSLGEPPAETRAAGARASGAVAGRAGAGPARVASGREGP